MKDIQQSVHGCCASHNLLTQIKKYFFYKSLLFATYSSAHIFLFVWRSVVKISHTLYQRKSDLIQVHFKSLSKTMSLIETGTLRRKTKENSGFIQLGKKQNWISHYALQTFWDPFAHKQQNSVFDIFFLFIQKLIVTFNTLVYFSLEAYIKSLHITDKRTDAWWDIFMIWFGPIMSNF